MTRSAGEAVRGGGEVVWLAVFGASKEEGLLGGSSGGDADGIDSEVRFSSLGAAVAAIAASKEIAVLIFVLGLEFAGAHA